MFFDFIFCCFIVVSAQINFILLFPIKWLLVNKYLWRTIFQTSCTRTGSEYIKKLIMYTWSFIKWPFFKMTLSMRFWDLSIYDFRYMFLFLWYVYVFMMLYRYSCIYEHVRGWWKVLSFNHFPKSDQIFKIPSWSSRTFFQQPKIET